MGGVLTPHSGEDSPRDFFRFWIPSVKLCDYLIFAKQRPAHSAQTYNFYKPFFNNI